MLKDSTLERIVLILLAFYTALILLTFALD